MTVEKRSDDVTKTKFFTIMAQVARSKKRKQDEKCPLAKNESVCGNWWRDISTILLPSKTGLNRNR